MKVTIPKWAETLEDEGIILFLAFMLRMSKHDDERTRYYMHLSDIRIFIGGWILSPAAVLDRIPEYKIRLGSASEKHWLFEWKEQPTELIDYTIQHKRMTAIWGYILGRELRGGLVTPSLYGKIPQEEPPVVKTIEDQEFFQYIGNRKAIRSLSPKKPVHTRKPIPEDKRSKVHKLRETGMAYATIALNTGLSINMCYRIINTGR